MTDSRPHPADADRLPRVRSSGSSGGVDGRGGARDESAGVDEIFRSTARQVEATLAGLPDDPIEARRRITRELGIDPGPEQLRTMLDLAHGCPPERPLAGLARRMLVTQVRAFRVLHDIRNTRSADPDRLALDERIVSRVLLESERDTDELRAALAEESSARAGDFLLQCAESFEIPRHALLAALTLLPRLRSFAAAGDADELIDLAPSLRADEATRILGALREDCGEPRPAARVCVEALVLRTMIEEDLADPALPARAGGDEPDDPERRSIAVGRLRRDLFAYHPVAEQLGKQRDAALVAGLIEHADEIRRVGRTLFSSRLKLASVLRAAEQAASAVGRRADGEDRDDAAAVGRLLRECEQTDDSAAVSTPAPGARGGGQQDRTATGPPGGAVPPGREQGRLRSLLRRAGVLGVVPAAIRRPL